MANKDKAEKKAPFIPLKFFSAIWQRRHSITSKLSLVFMVLFPCTMIVTGIYFYSVLSNMLRENITKDLAQLVQETNNQITSQLDMVDNAAIYIISNPNIRTNLLQRDPDDSRLVKTKRKWDIEEQMSYALFYNYAWESNLFESAYIFVSEEEYYYLIKYFKLNNFDQHVDIYRQFCSIGTPMSLYAPSADNRILYLARDINYINEVRSQGTIVLGITEDSLKKLYTNTLGYLNAQVYIYNQDGMILSCKEDEKVGGLMVPEFLQIYESQDISLVQLNGERYYSTVHADERFKIKTLILIPEKETTTYFSKSINIYIVVIFIGIIATAFLGVALSAQITRPIKNLVANIKKFKEGDMSVKMPIYKEYELNELSTVFNSMTDEIQILFAEIYEKQVLLKESELKLLQSQVNPHFLFNVLNTISWEARVANNDRVYRMITTLGQMMIANITFSDIEKLKVIQEMEYIEFYLFLQKIRFGERLVVTIDVDVKKFGEYLIPKFCVYTVVENAVVHGLENRIGIGKLQIAICEEQNDLVFSVSDNGIGFNTSNIDFNSVEKMKSHKNAHTNIGLYNANARIQLIYGKQYGIKIESEPNQGTDVVIRVPIDRGN